jgi:hypothetical protein
MFLSMPPDVVVAVGFSKNLSGAKHARATAINSA